MHLSVSSPVVICKTGNKFVTSQIIHGLMQNLKRNLLLKIPICSIPGKSGRIEKLLKPQFLEINTNANTTL